MLVDPNDHTGLLAVEEHADKEMNDPEPILVLLAHKGAVYMTLLCSSFIAGNRTINLLLVLHVKSILRSVSTAQTHETVTVERW